MKLKQKTKPTYTLTLSEDELLCLKTIHGNTSDNDIKNIAHNDINDVTDEYAEKCVRVSSKLYDLIDDFYILTD